MKRDNMKLTILAVMMAITLITMCIGIAVYDNKPVYEDIYHEGVVIAKNETRLMLYIEECNKETYRVWTFVVDYDEFIRFDIGDTYSWIVTVVVSPGPSLHNLTRSSD